MGASEGQARKAVGQVRVTAAEVEKDSDREARLGSEVGRKWRLGIQRERVAGAARDQGIKGSAIGSQRKGKNRLITQMVLERDEEGRKETNRRDNAKRKRNVE